jgi:hypothetical protein
MIEAMLTGTPVVTRPCGAAPEVVAHGVTGFIADSLDDLVAAVKRVDMIERRNCRRHVEERFSSLEWSMSMRRSTRGSNLASFRVVPARDRPRFSVGWGQEKPDDAQCW